MSTTLGNMGQIAEARMRFEAGIARYDPQHHDEYTSVHGFDPGVACRVEHGRRRCTADQRRSGAADHSGGGKR